MKGSVIFLYGGYKNVIYVRFTDKQAAVVILNDDYNEQTHRIPVQRVGVYDKAVMIQVIQTTEEGYSLARRDYVVEDNVLTITVPKISATVLISDLQR